MLKLNADACGRLWAIHCQATAKPYSSPRENPALTSISIQSTSFLLFHSCLHHIVRPSTSSWQGTRRHISLIPAVFGSGILLDCFRIVRCDNRLMAPETFRSTSESIANHPYPSVPLHRYCYRTSYAGFTCHSGVWRSIRNCSATNWFAGSALRNRHPSNLRSKIQ